MSQGDDCNPQHQRQGAVETDEVQETPGRGQVDAGPVLFPIAVNQPASPRVAPGSSAGGGSAAEAAEQAIIYAGFWRRVAAYVVDALIIQIANGGIVAIILHIGISAGIQYAGVGILLPLAISALYFSVFHASRLQATPGKLAVGIKVVRAHGARLSRARAFARWCGGILSGAALGIGHLMAAFTVRKQALHDVMCATLVVDKWAFTDQPHLQKKSLGILAWIILGLAFLLLAGYLFVMVMMFMFFQSLGSVLENGMSAFFAWLSRIPS